MWISKYKKKQYIKTSLIVIVFIGISIFAIKYISEINKKTEEEKAKIIPVVVATTHVKPQGIIKRESLAIKYLPEKFVIPNAAMKIDEVVDRVNLSILIPGEQILVSQTRIKGDVFGPHLNIPTDKRVVSIKFSHKYVKYGCFQAGDVVDVRLNYTESDNKQKTITIFQEVEIIDVNNVTDIVWKDANKYYQVSLVATFLLKIHEIERLQLANSKGRLTIALKSYTNQEMMAYSKSGITEKQLDRIRKAQSKFIKCKNKFMEKIKGGEELPKGSDAGNIVIWN
jgi:Flp pilus assembly protein CpaB